MTRKRVEVAAGVLLREDGRYLIGQRAPDTVYAGYWEFPGGKVEPGESPAQALVRELDEELGIRVTRLRPWLCREHVYEHAHVRLHFHEVAAWEGELADRVHSALAWVLPEGPAREPMLPANGPILKALRLPRLRLLLLRHLLLHRLRLRNLLLPLLRKQKANLSLLRTTPTFTPPR